MSETPSFNNLLTNSEKPVLVDFYATWCEPCKTLASELEKFAGEHKDQVKVIKVNVDNNTAAALNFKVRGVPTLILFRKGQEVWRHSGVLSAGEIKAAIDQYLASSST